MVGTASGAFILRAIAANRILDVLGAGARAARSAGLGGVLAAVRDAADAVSVRAGRPPLRAEIDRVSVRGYLRHRSYLAEAARPGTTYRELFARTLRPGLTVVDGGAHVGVYTVLAARGVGPSGTVLAFEPDPYNFAALTYNARRADGEHVRLHQQALAEVPRHATFHVSRGTIGSSLRRRGDTVAVRDVEVTSIDAALADARPTALLVKLNVEGAEPLALEGMRETLERVEDVKMFVEIDPLGLREAGVEPEELVARIEAHGFRVQAIRLADQKLLPLDRSAPLPKGHVFCERV